MVLAWFVISDDAYCWRHSWSLFFQTRLQSFSFVRPVSNSFNHRREKSCLFFPDFGSTIMLCFELKVSWYKNVVWVFLTKNHRKQHHINMENQFIYAVSKIDNGSSIDLIEKHQKSIDWFIKMWWTCVKRFLDLRTDRWLLSATMLVKNEETNHALS